MKITWFLAWRYLFRQRERHISFISIASVLGVMLGVATLVVVISVMNGFDRDLAGKLLQFHHHVLVESMYPETLETAKDEISHLDGVENASVFVQTQVFAEFDTYIVPLVVRGIDFSDPQEKEILDSFIKSKWGDDGFFIGAELKRKFPITDTITFYPLRKKISSQELAVRGTFQVGIYDIDHSYLIADIDAVTALGPNYLRYLGVRISNPWKADELKSQINALGLPLMVNSWIDTNRVLFSALKLEKITMFVILSLIILVATFSIFSLLMVKVVGKTKEIGILRALGFTGRGVRTIFALQGFLLGILGTAGGLGLGVLLCFLVQNYRIVTIPKEIYFIEYLPVYIAGGDIILIGGLSLLLSLGASFIPAMRTAQVSICRMLRYE